MSVSIDQPLSIGQFTCSFDQLRLLLGLPSTTKIKHVSMLSMGIVGKSSVRIVVEDEESIPQTEFGMETLHVEPRYRLGGETHRQFVGWGFEAVEVEPDELVEGDTDA